MLERKGKIKILKGRVKALPGFPDLVVDDWMPLVMEHYGLTERPKRGDVKYDQMYDFCKNKRKRLYEKQSKLLENPPAQPVESEDDYLADSAGSHAYPVDDTAQGI